MNILCNTTNPTTTTTTILFYVNKILAPPVPNFPPPIFHLHLGMPIESEIMDGF